MKLEKMIPLVMYDDQCYICIKFAKCISFLSRDKLLMVGHYSPLGKKLRNTILDSSALEMFWFIDKRTAFGGRAALIPLCKTIFSIKPTKKQRISIKKSCNTSCNTASAIFVRSASMITNSKKITLNSSII